MCYTLILELITSTAITLTIEMALTFMECFNAVQKNVMQKLRP